MKDNIECKFDVQSPVGQNTHIYIYRERERWIDLLNIVACMGVVLLHCSNAQVHVWDGNYDAAMYWGLFTHSFVLWPVAVFLMISGYNLIGREGQWSNYFKRRFFRTVVPFIFWSVTLSILFPPKEALSWREWTENLIMGHGRLTWHLWFFPPLFALYAVVPMLSVFMLHASNNLIKLFTWGCTFCFLVIPAIFRALDITLFVDKIPGYYLVAYGVLGYVIGKRPEVLKISRKLLCVAGLMSMFLMFILLLVFRRYEFPLLWATILTYASPLCMLTAIGVFVFFQSNYIKRWIFDSSFLSSDSLKNLSSFSFGVYLLHPIVISALKHTLPVLANEFCGFIVVYSISVVAVWIMKKIPLVKMIVP